jgi:hypothetical protein
MPVLHPEWEFVADTVMGGESRGAITPATHDGRTGMRLTGDVSLANDGGFVQMACDLADGAAFDASGWSGIEIDVLGNDESYELRLRTCDLDKPWQSYRRAFTAPPAWTTCRFPFDAFEPHRTEAPFDPARLRRLGVVAIGRVFHADVTVAAVRLFP